MNKQPVLLLVGGGALVGGLLIVLFGSTGDVPLSGRVQDLFGYGGSHIDAPGHGRDLFHTGVDIGGIKEGSTYAKFDSARDVSASQSFHGFGCLPTCDGHEAGFRWAVRHDVREASECIGLGWSQIEGCAAYALMRENNPEPSRGQP